MIPRDLDRRAYLSTLGTAGAAMLAGCAGDVDAPGDEHGDASLVEDEPDYDGWLDGVDHYEGTLDLTDEEQVIVGVGSEGGRSFTPPAIQVSPGATVVWEWTGRGGRHNVVEVDGAFESDRVTEAGHTFDHTFDDPGVYWYVCTPHRNVEMKGGVAVE